ncbi:glycoside hydrolase family 25 protein [Butyrivibrio sp. XPD2006]|uniref:glycoside hydrolase family 25 protein n=1 Tax=Butyrivibrio sp. XPD2006 TaxID=1280668 RepID=UPI0003B4A890|nr:glycoside hydrolase family 25 protein [Butyrivibrio sp. XPD2006]
MANSGDYRLRKGVRNTQNIISIIFLSLVALMALTFSIVLLIRNANLQRQEDAIRSELDALNQEGYYTEAEATKLVQDAKEEAAEETRNSIKTMIQQKLENGDGATSTIRSLFPDQIVVASSGRYYFFPISDDIEHHGFGEEDFEMGDDGFLKYVGDDSTVEVKNGIDVSRFQGKINWEKVKAAGIDFAIIRAGLRGTTEGKLLTDDFFEDNIEGATENGIDVGVYFYSQAVNKEEAEEEVQLILDLIEPYKVTYPVVIDVESAESDSARTVDLTTDDYELVVKTFCDMVSKAGYKPMIYGNVKSYTLLMDAIDVDDYDIWIAYYGTPLYYPYHFNIWQYTSSGRVDGIDGDVDLNICITDY